MHWLPPAFNGVNSSPNCSPARRLYTDDGTRLGIEAAFPGQSDCFVSNKKQGPA